MMTARRLPLLFAFLAFLSLTACGGGDAPTGPSGPAPPPPNPDRDGDGILNSVDACPDQAEVFNGLVDDDGCPDDTLDFYLAVRADVEDVWEAEVFVPLQLAYRSISTFTSYSAPISTPCGPTALLNASYCPTNEGVYYHRFLLDTLLAEIGDAAPAFIVAHEVSHHIQNLLGITDWLVLGLITTKQHELQADCFSGAWGASVAIRGLLDEGDLEEVGRVLYEIGDDTLGGPWFNPAGHGTALQRQAAFALGFLFGLAECIDPSVFPPADVEESKEAVELLRE